MIERLAFAGLVVLVCAVPWDLREPYWRIAGVTITTVKIALLFAFAAILAWLVVDGARKLSRERLAAALLAALFCLGTLRPDALKFGLRLALGTAVFAGALAVPWTTGRFGRLGLAFVISALLAGGMGMIQALSVDHTFFHWFSTGPVFAPDSGALRLSGTMLDPTSLATILAVALPWVPLAFRNPHLITLVTAGLVAALMGTLARGPLLVGLIVAGVGAWRAGNHLRGPILAGLILPLIVGALFWPSFRNRWEWRPPAAQDSPFRFFAPPPAATPGRLSNYPFVVSSPDERGWPPGTPLKARLLVRDEGSGQTVEDRDIPIPSVPPGGEVNAQAGIPVPQTPGRYLVEIIASPGVTFHPRIRLIVADGRASWLRLPGPENPPDRWQFWGLALREIARHPWLGLGPERFRTQWHEWIPDAKPDPRHSPYNLILESWVNGGAIAGLPFTALVGLLIWNCIGAVRRGGPSGPPAVPAACLSGLAWLAIGMTESFFQSTSLLAGFWLSMGLVMTHETRD